MKILTALLLNWVLLAFLFMPNITRAFNKTMLSYGGEEFPALIGGKINSNMGMIIIHDWFGITRLTNESVNRLTDKGMRVIAVGYSAGAKFALNAAAENPCDIRAVALIYDGGYDSIDQKMLAKVGPILAIYGSEDEWSHKSFVVLNERMDKIQKNIETYIYPNARHAFAQKLFNGGKSLDPVATKAMRHVLDSFLERNFSSKTKSK